MVIDLKTYLVCFSFITIPILMESPSYELSYASFLSKFGYRMKKL